MAEKKKKKQPKALRGMPKTSIKSRMPSKAAKGQAGKKSIMPGLTGAVKAAKARRKKKISSDKWVLGEKLTKAGRSRARRRKTEKKLKKMGGTRTSKSPKGTVTYTKKKGDKYYMSPTKKKMLGSRKGTKIRKGAVGAVVTEAGVYAKYGKKSKAAGSFRSAFKSKCAGGAKSFSWDGRSYSCTKAGSPKKSKAAKKPTSPAKKPIARGGPPGSAEHGT